MGNQALLYGRAFGGMNMDFNPDMFSIYKTLGKINENQRQMIKDEMTKKAILESTREIREEEIAEHIVNFMLRENDLDCNSESILKRVEKKIREKPHDPSCKWLLGRQRFYFTFGSGGEIPYQGGWVEIFAISLNQAKMAFEKIFCDREILNCDGHYTEKEFIESGMLLKGNLGKHCHAVVIVQDICEANPHKFDIVILPH